MPPLVDLDGSASLTVDASATITIGLPGVNYYGTDSVSNPTQVVISTSGGDFNSGVFSNASYTTGVGETADDLYWRSAWWQYTPVESGTATFDNDSGSGDLTLTVFTTSTAAPYLYSNLTEVAFNDDIDGAANRRSRVSDFAVTANTTYLIRVCSYDNEILNYALHVDGPITAEGLTLGGVASFAVDVSSLSLAVRKGLQGTSSLLVDFLTTAQFPEAKPMSGSASLVVDVTTTAHFPIAKLLSGTSSLVVDVNNVLINDTFETATEIIGYEGFTTGTTKTATRQAEEPTSIGPTVWYKWTATRDTLARVSTDSQSFVPKIYTGTAVGSLTELTELTPAAWLTEEEINAVSFDAEDDTTYYIRIESTTVGSGTFTLYWEDLNPLPRVSAVDVIDFWHPLNDASLEETYFEWGPVSPSSSADKEFRIRNSSLEYYAAGIIISVTELDDVEPGLSVPAQHFLSSDGEYFSATVTIDELPPGAVSDKIILRRVTAPEAAIGNGDFQVAAVVGGWS